MGKVRQWIERDDHSLAQWIYRKLANHDPMSIRDKTKIDRTSVEFLRHVEGTERVEYITGTKIFAITVEEIDAPTLPAVQPAKW